MHGENVVVPFLILLSPLLGVPFNAAAVIAVLRKVTATQRAR